MDINFQAKPVSPIPLFVVSLLIFFLMPSTSAQNTTAYDVLQQYNFPIGILPKDAVGYKLDNSTGKFEVYLNNTCSFKIQSHKLKYKSTISGDITEDKISNLDGVQTKVLFLWVKIRSVTRQDNELQFSVGVASAHFPVSNFNESPTCYSDFDNVKGIGNHVNKSPNFILS
ncbi:uncharacterized protein At5g01610-like [Gastrolobium bilobum]|uniref:uncharacterized protein At5g01610-like n=1 Tax=Gastrolobium bilobum TaxID=150636 RepID=UPI002AAF108F|nr:uncharacterized protein At5g01610-like [Gastrolobium bilobum]XP_061351892.1 uncharacterized protein At5g01610-like [Gastrolobium bilobum]XP_061351893.1 uncharacterized protein At5g01610-like [Gastrolobium bilobum]